MAGYSDDLAAIHETGFSAVAAAAAALLGSCLPRHRDGSTPLVVDLGCGGGTLARALVDAGFDVLGVDVSESMVRLARERVPEARFEHASLFAYELPACVGVACIGETLNYLFDEQNSDAALDAFFDRVQAALVPGGVFLLDVATPERRGGRATRGSLDADGWHVEAESSVTGGVLTRRIVSRRRLPDGSVRRTEEVHRQRLLDPDRLAQALAGRGFEVERLTGYGGASFAEGVAGLLARRP